VACQHSVLLGPLMEAQVVAGLLHMARMYWMSRELRVLNEVDLCACICLHGLVPHRRPSHAASQHLASLRNW
jgi:hypothetical protein